MAKDYDWDAARGLWSVGKTDRQIEAETGIPRATVQRRAKKEGWTKGSMSHAVSSGLQFVKELSQGSEPEILAAQSEVERIAKLNGYANVIALKVMKRISNNIEANTEDKYLKQHLDAANAALVLGGAIPRPGAKEKEQVADEPQVKFYLPKNGRDN